MNKEPGKSWRQSNIDVRNVTEKMRIEDEDKNFRLEEGKKSKTNRSEQEQNIAEIAQGIL